MPPPEFSIYCAWELGEFLGYIPNCLATQRVIEARREDLLEAFVHDLSPIWGRGQAASELADQHEAGPSMSNNALNRPLEAGLRHSEQLFVATRHTVPEVDNTWHGFGDMPPVLATAMMIGFIEQTCVEALRPYLTPAQRTVGTHVDVSHIAATPVGMSIKAEVELVAVEGRKLRFRVHCSDEAGPIGEGTHERAIVDFDKFLKRVMEKKDQA